MRDAPVQPAVRRVRPGEVMRAFGMWPDPLRFRDDAWSPRQLPALVAEWDTEVRAVAFWTLCAEGLVLFGPYGSLGVAPVVVAEARRVAAAVGQDAVWAPVGNDEIDRFEALQRLGFVLAEARLGVFAAEDSGAMALGGAYEGNEASAANGAGMRIAHRDELILRLAVGPTGGET